MGWPKTRIHFPDASLAGPNGLLWVGGQLTPEWLLEAYCNGIFPWPHVEDGHERLAWYSPDPRAVIELADLYISKRLARRLRSEAYSVTINTAFEQVVRGCAAPRSLKQGTWISEPLISAYRTMHELGYAHSVEVWHGNLLAGGLYGVAMGGFFAGESMFHCRRDASKIALVSTVRQLKKQGFVLFDIQVVTAHTLEMGACVLPREQFLQRVRAAVSLPVTFVTPAGLEADE